MISLVTAMTEKGVIGQDGAIPWHIPEEQQLFKQLTYGHSVIMGRKTFETCVKHPLPGRLNIVISKTKTFPGTLPAQSLEEAINIAKKHNKEIFIIGGEQIYRQALPLANTLYVSHIKKKFAGDAYFPPFRTKSPKSRLAESSTKANETMKFNKKEWKAIQEKQYAEFNFITYQKAQ